MPRSYKYVAVNTLTGIVVKKFSTRFYAHLWMNQPIKIAGMKFSKPAFFIALFVVDDERVENNE